MKERLKSISRIDQPHKRNHGWYVRVVFRRKIHSKFFSDACNGGRENALRRAVRYRNALEKSLGKPRTDRVIVGSSQRPGGIVGVVKKLGYERQRNGSIKRVPIYEVTWCPEPCKVALTSVSINKHGQRRAFERACAIRRQKEREIYGSGFSP